MKLLKLLSLFSGIGAFEKSLDRLEIPYELVGYCEIDKYASKSYSAINSVPESMNLGDITKIDEKALPKDIDLITYGFPCQDISLAGKQKGLFNEDGTQTRSGLFFEALRIIEETKPKVAIAENVKNLVSKKFETQFQIVLDSLEQAGYNNYWKVLNAKDYGIPQNRERVFIVSIRKDVDTGMFEFPKPFELKLRLKDMLDDVVDEKYYLNTDRADGLIEKLKTREVNHNPEGVDVVGDLWEDNGHGSMAGRVYNTEGQCPTLGASHFQQIKYILDDAEKVVQCGNVNPSGRGQNGQVIDSEGLARTITVKKGEGQKILVRTNNSKGYDIAEPGDYINIERPTSTTHRGRVGHGVSQCLDTKENHCVVTTEPSIQVVGNYSPSGHDASRIVDADGLAPTVKENHGTVTATVVNEPTSLRIRKLTPKECFRLMGFDDADFEKAEKVNSNTQLYKQAGNSIVVDVLEYLIKALIDSGALEVRKENKEMELRINDYQLPEAIDFNYEEIKQELIGKTAMYTNLVYTDEQIKDAKNDKASLNKLKKALNDERIRLEREYMQPFNDTKAKFNELIALVDEPVKAIDTQVKAYEDKQKQDKFEKIKEYFTERYLNSGTPAPDFFTLERIFDEKWLNASVSMKSIQEAIDAKAEQVKNDLATLQNLPEFGFEATEVYKTTLDLNRALNEGKRLADIAKKKAEQEAEQARLREEASKAAIVKPEPAPQPVQEGFINPPVEEAPAKQLVKFAAYLSVEDAEALKAFFLSRQIEFRAI